MREWEHFRNFISEIASERIVLLATHIVSDVESIAKEIILLKNGEVIGNGKPYELIEKIKSYVYEIYIPQDKLKEVQEKYIILDSVHGKNEF